MIVVTLNDYNRNRIIAHNIKKNQSLRAQFDFISGQTRMLLPLRSIAYICFFPKYIALLYRYYASLRRLT